MSTTAPDAADHLKNALVELNLRTEYFEGKRGTRSPSHLSVTSQDLGPKEKAPRPLPDCDEPNHL